MTPISRLNSAAPTFAEPRTFLLYLFFFFLEGGDGAGRGVGTLFRQNFRRASFVFTAFAGFRFFSF